MKPSRHAFKPDERHPTECSICGRSERAHQTKRDRARERAGEAASPGGNWEVGLGMDTQ